MEQYAQLLLMMMNSQNEFQSANFNMESYPSEFQPNSNFPGQTDWTDPGLQQVTPNSSKVPLRHTERGGGEFKSEVRAEAFGEPVNYERP
jgi:hypothetical protein